MCIIKHQTEKKSHVCLPLGLSNIRMLIILCVLYNLGSQMPPDFLMFMVAMLN